MRLKNKKNRILYFMFSFAVFAFVYFLAGGSFFVVSGEETISEEDQKAADAKQEKVDKYQDQLEEAQADKEESVQKKIIISNDINQINSNISVIESKIAETEKQINDTRSGIVEKEKSIKERNEMIAGILREINQADSELRLFLLRKNADFDDYFLAVDLFQQMEGHLSEAVAKLENEKADLEEKKKEQEDTKAIRDDQKETLEVEQNKKYAVLNQTQAEINSKDVEIGNIQAKISKLKADISSLLGKGYDAKDIEDAAKFASKATGVRKDFLLGMLVVESDLGRYTGGCDYKESRMSSSRKSYFKDICEELGYNYKKMKVSCPPASYSGTGGAMGVAQFMSDTWIGYKSDIATATGHNPPDPWNLTDGVTAMALKLAKGGATSRYKTCDSPKNGECKAALLYLSGTTNYDKYGWYCTRTCYWADNYEKLMGD